MDGGPEVPPFLTGASGVFLRQPRGGVEDVQEMKNAGMEWVSCNVRDHAPEEWDTVRSRAAATAMPCKPWGRLGIPQSGDTRDDCLRVLERLYAASDSWGEKCIPNVEDEFKDILPPAELAPEIDDRVEGISTVGWLYNGVDFKPIAHLPFLLQVFWEDMRFDPVEVLPGGMTLMESKQRECVYHAREKGVTYVGVTLMTVRSKPSFYAYLKGTRSWYTGDDIGGGQWGAWAV